MADEEKSQTTISKVGLKVDTPQTPRRTKVITVERKDSDRKIVFEFDGHSIIFNGPNGEVRHLESGQIIPTEYDDVVIGVLGNSIINENALRLKWQDQHPIKVVNKDGTEVFIDTPGRSAFLLLEGKPEKLSRGQMQVICQSIVKRDADRRDNIYTISIGKLRELGIGVVYYPTSPDHVRLIPLDGNYTVDENDFRQFPSGMVSNIIKALEKVPKLQVSDCT